jgi:hypothetical protein
VGKPSIIFCVVLVTIGQIILLKLFLAILLENFEDKRKELIQRKEEEKAGKHIVKSDESTAMMDNFRKSMIMSKCDKLCYSCKKKESAALN